MAAVVEVVMLLSVALMVRVVPVEVVMVAHPVVQRLRVLMISVVVAVDLLVIMPLGMAVMV
jgi:hypothetical protein